MTEAAVDLMSNRHRIARWMRGLWADDVESTPDKLALRHVAVSDRQIDVASFVVADKPSDDQEALLSRIEEALENDADGLGGVQKYVLLALWEGRPLSRLPLRVASSMDDGGSSDSLESEPANSKGLLAQLMRHNEVQSRMFAMSMGQVVSTMQRTIARLQETVEVADERRLAAVDVAEDMLTRGHERAALTQMVEDNRAAKTVTFNTVKSVMPFVMHYLRKAAGMPVETTPVATLVSQLAASLQPEQLAGLQKLLTTEQMETIGKIFAASPSENDDGATTESETANG
jgi:hypothetical protein